MSEISLYRVLTNGLIDFPWWGYLAVMLTLTHITIAAVTIYLHRHQAHHALDLHPVPAHFFRFWLWLTTGMVTREWVAVHRKHHAKVETAADPHSPKVVGIRTVLLQGAELYRQEAGNLETLERYGHGTPDDWVEQRLYSPHSGMGVVLMLIVNMVLFGPLGVSIWAMQMLWIPFWAAGVVNGLGHWWGYRSFESADTSHNLTPIGVLIGGEEMHNNHHAFPSSAKFSCKWWEFDIGWTYIKILQVLRLARVKKIAPRLVRRPDKDKIDMDTLRAVILNRLHVMAAYGRTVMLPVLRQERGRADASCRRVFKQARWLVIRDTLHMDAKNRGRLERILEISQVLRVVYQYRLGLQEVWTRSATSHEHLLHALQEWCTQAEATGIDALQQFARGLRGYSMGSTSSA